MNKTSAKEWLNKAWHHFSSAKLLYEANHFTDVIAVDLHYAIEIMLKSPLAYENKKIIKTHDLIEVSGVIEKYINFDFEEKKLLILVSIYHIRGSYPPRDKKMPSRDELKVVLKFAGDLFDKICNILDIEKNEVKK